MRSGAWVWACVSLLGLACHGPDAREPVLLAASPVAGSSWGVVAEGLCSKLSGYAAGGRTVLAYGDTGYVARDWGAGETLPARQALAVMKGDDVLLDASLLRGLPRRDGGWVAGDLTLGGDASAWLVRATTRYATRRAGALFEREERAYTWTGAGWSLAPGDGDGTRRVPGGVEEPSAIAACGDAALSFVRLASHALPSGDVFVAGRCRADGPVNPPARPIVVATRGAELASAWRVSTAAVPELDAIVDVALAARAPDDAWLSAYEPFKPTAARAPVLAHWDGRAWTRVATPAKSGISSLTVARDGTLWLAAGHELLARASSGAFRVVELPPLAFTSPSRPDSLRITGVRAMPSGELFVEGGFLARRGGEEARASVLFASPPPVRAAWCDASKPADEALAVVEERVR